MNRKRRNNLAAKIIILAIMVSGPIVPWVQAALPVIDTGNLQHNIITAAQSVAAVEKQIQQYQTQLQQYENMLQNTKLPKDYIWDQAEKTISKLLEAQDTLTYYKNHAGSLDAYLSRYQDIDAYQNSSSFNNEDAKAQRKVVLNARAQGSAAQKRANDAALRSVDQQQQTLVQDAATLTRLQAQASHAEGHMQALQAANQLASAQLHQLLQLRGLLIAQQNAVATRAQVVADREAQQAVVAQQIRSGKYTKSPARSWGVEDGVQ